MIFQNVDTVPQVAPDQKYIQEMFNRLARRYDIFTSLIGFGQAKYQREETLRPLKKGMRVLDLGCGTGDLALAAVQKLGRDGDVVGLDFSEAMLAMAQKRYEKLPERQTNNFHLVLRKAEDLPLEDGKPFDLIVSGFVLRNLYANIDKILEGVCRSLKSGGQISFLDLTQPVNPVLASIFRFYMLTFVGFYGAILFGKDYPIPYLPDSAKRFLKAHEFVKTLEKAGFQNVKARSFILGSVTLYQATKA